MKVLFNIMMMVAVLAVAFQCNPSSEREVDFTVWQRDLEDEKQEIMQVLNGLSDTINIQLQHITSRTAQADKDVQDLTSNAERRLLTEKDKIESAMKDVRSSTENTWDDVRNDVSDKVIDVKIEVSRVREKIRNEIDTNK